MLAQFTASQDSSEHCTASYSAFSRVSSLLGCETSRIHITVFLHYTYCIFKYQGSKIYQTKSTSFELLWFKPF